MKRRVLFPVVLLLSLGVAMADNWVVKNSDTIQNLEAVWFTSPQNGWVVGDAGTVLKSTDGGDSWMAVDLATQDLKDVTFLNDQIGLIVGDDGKIFRTTNGGANWSPVTSNTTSNLEGAAFGTNGYAYAVGRDGVILRSLDNGQTWSVLATGDARYRAVYAVGDMYAWIVGNEGAMAATINGGLSWESQGTGSAADLHDVFFLDSMTGWTVGQNDVVYKTTNGGGAWTPMNSGVNVGLEAVGFVDAGLGLVVGNNGRTFDTTNGGLNWVLNQSPAAGELNDLFLSSASLAWAVGNSGVILKRGSAVAATPVNLADHPTLGKILVDGAGNTLYFYTMDAFDASVCEGLCKANWPIFYADMVQAGAGLDVADFGSVLRADGDMQTTYKGWPLYYFVGDNAAGQANGEDVNGVWYVAKPDYAVMLVNNQLVGHDGVQYNGSYEPGQEVVQYFVDAYGRTLYGFINDDYNNNNFTAPDFGNNPVWPIYETANKTAPSVVDSSLFSVIDVFGHSQLCYNGWPLYYFGQDSLKRGLNKGVSFPSPGVWPIITADTQAAPTPVVLADDPGLGTILTDGAGFTLYYYTPDAFDNSVCAGQCKVYWPIFYGENIEAGAGLDAADFATITRPDGDLQTTYKGWPLYYYIGDGAPGDVNGEDVEKIWYVAKPDYAIMLVDNQLVGHNGIEYNGNYEPGQEVIQYFVDAYGRTLYAFINDTFEDNNFTNADFSNNAVWPIYETENTVAPSVIDRELFSVIDVFGHKQLCYKGWPIYYFGQDSLKRGLNKGISFPAPGVWPVLRASMDFATGVAERPDVAPAEFTLEQNYPNPFNPTTTISFALPRSGEVSLVVFDTLGRAVRTLINNKRMEAGVHQVAWRNALDDSGRQLSSGLYFYTLKSGDFSSTKRMLLLK